MPTSDPVTTSTTNTSTDPKVNPAPETDNLVIDFGETQETPVTPEENSVSELSSNTEAEQVSSGEDFVLDFWEMGEEKTLESSSPETSDTANFTETTDLTTDSETPEEITKEEGQNSEWEWEISLTPEFEGEESTGNDEFSNTEGKEWEKSEAKEKQKVNLQIENKENTESTESEEGHFPTIEFPTEEREEEEVRSYPETEEDNQEDIPLGESEEEKWEEADEEEIFSEESEESDSEPETLPSEETEEINWGAEEREAPMFKPFEESPIEEENSIEMAENTAEQTSSYEPTPEAFNQTLEALNAAKEAGEQVITWDQLETPLPTTQPTEQPSEAPQQMLSLDEMLAKQNTEGGISLEPSDVETEIQKQEEEKAERETATIIDPCEPMKKAIEDYEKEQLEKKNVDIQGIPLVIDVKSEQEETPLAPNPELTIPEPVSQEQPATISLDQLSIPEPSPLSDPTPQVAPQAPQPTVIKKSPLENFKQPKILTIIGALIVISVGAYVFLANANSTQDPLPPTPVAPDTNLNDPTTLPADTTPEDPITEDHNTSSGSNEQGEGEEFGAAEEIEGNIPETPENNGEWEPFFEETQENTAIHTELSETEIPSTSLPETLPSSEELALQFSNYGELGKSYLEIGESQNDLFLVKYGGYVTYQANLLAKTPPLDIQEYTTITLRIEDILTKLKAYLDGSYNPNPAPAMETETPINDPAAYEEIKNFVDSQGGMI